VIPPGNFVDEVNIETRGGGNVREGDTCTSGGKGYNCNRLSSNWFIQGSSAPSILMYCS
jgi:hypothetical protein